MPTTKSKTSPKPTTKKQPVQVGGGDYSKILNPATGKHVQAGGAVGKKLIKNYRHGTIVNPATGKAVKTGGKIGGEVLKRYRGGSNFFNGIKDKFITNKNTLFLECLREYEEIVYIYNNNEQITNEVFDNIRKKFDSIDKKLKILKQKNPEQKFEVEYNDVEVNDATNEERTITKKETMTIEEFDDKLENLSVFIEKKYRR